MNCMMAKRHRILLSVLALFLIGACSRNEEIEQQTSPSGGVEVAILCDNTKEPQIYSLPDGTRTWIDDNDWASTRWDKNDKIALWATADGSNYTLNAQHFSLAYFTPSYSTAVFSSTVADMPAGTYTYTAVSPVPENVSGTQVSYQIPAKQTGRYEGKWDILAADPTRFPCSNSPTKCSKLRRRTRCASVTNATHCESKSLPVATSGANRSHDWSSIFRQKSSEPFRSTLPIRRPQCP